MELNNQLFCSFFHVFLLGIRIINMHLIKASFQPKWCYSKTIHDHQYKISSYYQWHPHPIRRMKCQMHHWLLDKDKFCIYGVVLHWKFKVFPMKNKQDRILRDRISRKTTKKHRSKTTNQTLESAVSINIYSMKVANYN